MNPIIGCLLWVLMYVLMCVITLVVVARAKREEPVDFINSNGNEKTGDIDNGETIRT